MQKNYSVTFEDAMFPEQRVYHSKHDDSPVVVFPISIGSLGRIRREKPHLVMTGKRTIEGGQVFTVTKKAVSTEENLRQRHYIGCGQECAVCLEPMFFKTNASLLECGHGFHTTCLFNCDKALILRVPSAPVVLGRCPVCRDTYGFDADYKTRYVHAASVDFSCAVQGFHRNYYMLDQLESFWDVIHLMLPYVCPMPDRTGKTPWHYAGTATDAQCEMCSEFRKLPHPCIQK